MMGRSGSGERMRLNAGRLWAGGAATAIVAAGVAFVGHLAVETIFSLPALNRWQDEVFVGDRLGLAIAAAVAALVATALLHLLLLSAPRAQKFFGWIAGLVIVGLILEVLLTGYSWLDKLMTSALYLVIGIAITSLLRGVAHTAQRYERQSSRHEQTPGWETGGFDDDSTRRTRRMY